jgi:hypothetical protein
VLKTKMPPKSILKKSAMSTDGPPGRKPVNRRHYETALHHANILEQRKQTETQVLKAILAMLEFPPSPDADPKRPSLSDANQFRQYIKPFQPSDYDSLIEERNIADRCGYALCPRPKRRAPSRARKQFIETDRGVEIVDRKVLEVWCSDDCARRALYVKVQLNEEPAWLRQGGVAPPIELLVENEQEHRMSLPLRPKQEATKPAPSKPDADEVAAAWAAHDDALADLAIERGETPGRLSKANKDLITDRIKERVGGTAPVAPTPGSGQSHMAIEGHIPRANAGPEQSDEDDEEDAQDWDVHLPG